MQRKRPVIRFRVLVGLLVIAAAGSVGFLQAGNFLVVQDGIPHAEVAVILSGDSIRRALAARDLYQQRRVEQILIIPEPPDPADAELIHLGLLDPTLPSWSERILLASGVPRANILVLPDPANGTIMEATQVHRALRGHWPKTLVVITSKFASRRARFIFRWVFARDGVRVTAYPTPYDPFQPTRWWTQPRNALYVVMEYQKFFVNVLTLTFRTAPGTDRRLVLRQD